MTSLTLHSLGEDVEFFSHLSLKLLFLQPAGVAHDYAEVLEQGGDVRQQQPGALSQRFWRRRSRFNFDRRRRRPSKHYSDNLKQQHPLRAAGTHSHSQRPRPQFPRRRNPPPSPETRSCPSPQRQSPGRRSWQRGG